LESAKLKLNQTKIIEQGPEQTFTIRKDTYSQNTETRHFTGYLLLENAGRKFFMDIDRLEIEHKIFNVFFVEVDKSVKTAMQAYESMKPEIVRDAENAGLKVLRQGEWFFIPTNEKIRMPIKNIYNRILRDNFPYPTIQQFNISHGKGRPNSLFKVVIDGIEGSLVCGMVRHLGREHNPLKLGYRYVNPELENNTIDQFDQGYSHAGSEEIIEVDLFTVVGNTTVSNFTVTGDVD
jgi:hypothetical protein